MVFGGRAQPGRFGGDEPKVASGKGREKLANCQRFDERGDETHRCGKRDPTDHFRSAFDEGCPHIPALSAGLELSLEHFAKCLSQGA